MAVDSIVRVSFQSVVEANQAANSALVGVNQGNVGPRPYEKIGTALYSCSNADEQDVANSLADLGHALATYAPTIDFVSITVARR